MSMNRREALAGIGLASLMPGLARGQTKPNLVYFLFDDQDDHNAQSFCPNIKQVGFHGIHFLNTFGDCSSCGPARVSVLTGMSSRNHGLYGDRTPKGGFEVFNAQYGAHSLPVQLQKEGYKTSILGRIMTDFVQDSSAPQGFDDYHLLCGTKNPFAYRSFYMNDNGVVTRYDPSLYSTDVLSQKATDFINGAGDGPWALFIFLNAPHGAGYMNYDDAPEPATEDLNADVGNQPQGGAWSEADVSDKPHATVNNADHPMLDSATSNFVWQCRRRTMMSADRLVGSVVAQLTAKNLINSTYVIVSSDNGYAEGANRNPEKIMLYDASQRIPGFIRGPGIPKTGSDRTELINNLDITATIFAVTGATPYYPLDGVSLVPMFNGAAVPWRTEIFVENNISKGARTASDVYMVSTTPEYGTEEEYYDFSVDPLEMRNAHGKSQYAARESVLGSALTGFLASGRS